MLSALEKQELVNFLTLRYNPVPPDNKSITWKDFLPKNEKVTLTDAAIFVSDTLTKSLEDLKENKLGLTVSGGIDSSILLARAYTAKKELVTFSVLIDGKRDSLAEYVTGKFETDHHDIVINRIFEELPYHIWLVKKPIWHMWSYYLIKYASHHCNILCTGDGGDELFGGYTFRYKTFLSGDLTNSLQKVKAYLNGHGRDWVPDQEHVFPKLVGFSWERIYSLLLPYFDNPLEPLDQVFLADFNGKLLHDWKPVFQSWADEFRIRLFKPFLNHEIVQFATKLPIKLKYDPYNGVGKLVLRKILEQHSLDRISVQGKQGFSFDTIQLWEREGKEIFDYLMEKSEIVEADLINKEWIDKTLLSPDKMRNYSYVNKLLAILALEVWHRIFITRSMSPNTKL